MKNLNPEVTIVVVERSRSFAKEAQDDKQTIILNEVKNPNAAMMNAFVGL